MLVKTVKVLVKNIRLFQRKLLNTIIWKLLSVDVFNYLKYGKFAPKYAQQITMKVTDCNLALPAFAKSSRRYSGIVRGGDWDKNAIPIKDNEKIAACINRFSMGIDWEDTNIIRKMSIHLTKNKTFDNCSSYEDIIERYEKLDSVFEQIKKEKRVRSAKELGLGFRESGGIYVHINRNGDPIIAGGFHRFAMAYVLNLDTVPAMIGMVHKNALPSFTRFLKSSL